MPASPRAHDALSVGPARQCSSVDLPDLDGPARYARGRARESAWLVSPQFEGRKTAANSRPPRTLGEHPAAPRRPRNWFAGTPSFIPNGPVAPLHPPRPLGGTPAQL